MNSKYLLGFLSLIGVYVLFLVCFETLKERGNLMVNLCVNSSIDEFRDNNNLNSKQHRSSFRIREGPEEVNKTITTTRMETQPKYFSVDYEVFGKVQGYYSKCHCTDTIQFYRCVLSKIYSGKGCRIR